MKFGVKFGEIFRATFSRGLGVRQKISLKFHVKNGVENGKFHANFSLCWCAALTRVFKKSTATWGSISDFLGDFLGNKEHLALLGTTIETFKQAPIS